MLGAGCILIGLALVSSLVLQIRTRGLGKPIDKDSANNDSVDGDPDIEKA